MQLFLIIATLLLPAEGQADELDLESVVSLLEFVIDSDESTARRCLGILTAKVQSRELRGDRLEGLREQLGDTIAAARQGTDQPLAFDATLLAASWGDPEAVTSVGRVLLDRSQPEPRRLRALDALASADSTRLLKIVPGLLGSKRDSSTLRGHLLAALGRSGEPTVSRIVLDYYSRLDEELRPKAIELLTQRPAWSKDMLAAIGSKEFPADAINVNQVAKLLASRDPELVELVRAKWGSVRTERNPQREQVIHEMREFLAATRGDALRGGKVFAKVCGQCHKIHGQGQDVGPDITRNGRASFDQLLSNVFDPSLVIGAAYQARTVITADGRVLTGLMSEDNQQRVVLKTQGGKLEIVARDDVDEVTVSRLSLMPEGLEKQLKPVELADLFEFLLLDRPPDDPAAVRIPGAPAIAR